MKLAERALTKLAGLMTGLMVFKGMDSSSHAGFEALKYLFNGQVRNALPHLAITFLEASTSYWAGEWAAAGSAMELTKLQNRQGRLEEKQRRLEEKIQKFEEKLHHS